MFSSLRSPLKLVSSKTKNTFLQNPKFISIKKTASHPHPLFSHKSLREDVWMIEEKYFISWNRANIFFIRGTTADLLVDTGEFTLELE
jgi:hypothetical protein